LGLHRLETANALNEQASISPTVNNTPEQAGSYAGDIMHRRNDSSTPTEPFQNASMPLHIFGDRHGCTDCGACASACPTGALRMCGIERSAVDVAREALDDILFFENSGGGVTISGGEPLMQPKFTLEILKLIKNKNIHTIVETSGYGNEADLISLAPYTDCFYFDYKLCDAGMYSRYIGKGHDVVFNNLRKLRSHTDGVVLRIPLIPDITDTIDNLFHAVDLAAELRIPEIQLLPYNPAAGAKYEWTGQPYRLGPAEWSPPDMGLLMRHAEGAVKIVLNK